MVNGYVFVPAPNDRWQCIRNTQVDELYRLYRVGENLVAARNSADAVHLALAAGINVKKIEKLKAIGEHVSE